MEDFHRPRSPRATGSELVIIPSASHLSNLEQPTAFTRALALFLNKHR